MRPRRTQRAWILAGALLAGGAAAQAPAPPDGQGEQGAVARPGEVPLDHKLHAGEYKIPCLACHVHADKAPVAGLPSGRKCMGCHKFVAKEKPAVQLLYRRFEAGTPLRWERVFTVPDFIYFSHRVHVRAKVDCKECHGDIAASKVVRGGRPFTMGSCLDCHEQRKATRECLACHK